MTLISFSREDACNTFLSGRVGILEMVQEMSGEENNPNSKLFYHPF